MKVSEGKLGRVFLVRLESGDNAVEAIERFAIEKSVQAAHLFLVSARALFGVIAPNAEGVPQLRLPSGESLEREEWLGGEVVIQEMIGLNFRRVLDPSSGKETLARVISTKTRVMEKPAPTPEESGPGTVPVYLFNAEFN